MNEIIASVLHRIKPSQEDYDEINSICEKFISSLTKKAAERNIKGIEVRTVGSIAKDTWLKDDRDIDIFVLFPKSCSIDTVRRLGFELAKETALEIAGSFSSEYAEHPYVSVSYRGFKVEIVPCYKIAPGEKPITAVDRTPLHTEYINKKLSSSQKDQVRILKKFLKGIGVYGAEIRIKGFSGYLTELLIANYGTFLNVLKAVISWKPYKTIIDVEGKLSEEQKKKYLKKFSSPLIVVDPVDPERNAASAVSIDALAELRYAAQMFLLKPSLDFFFPKESEVSLEEIRKIVKERGTDLIALETLYPKLPEDIFWGEAYKSLKRLCNLLRCFDFNVINSGVWTDEKNRLIFILELEASVLPPVKKHKGPPVGSMNEQDFLFKHLNNPRDLSRPFSENGVWYVFFRRKYTSAETLLKERALSCGLSKHIRGAMSKKMRILSTSDILDIADHSVVFRQFLYKWLTKHRPWIYVSQSLERK